MEKYVTPNKPTTPITDNATHGDCYFNTVQCDGGAGVTMRDC